MDEVVRELHKVKDEIINGEICFFFSQYFLDGKCVNAPLDNSLTLFFFFGSQPSDMKSAESVHPNLTGAMAGGERNAGGGCTERRARRNVLSMFLQAAEALCQHLSLLDSKT